MTDAERARIQNWLGVSDPDAVEAACLAGLFIASLTGEQIVALARALIRSRVPEVTS